ncbi:pentatricopeptide repeat-containing protein At2g35030, mitochondrial-like [Selaginella moellendorffii]|uniref:pentatricopeptide repeat-containing protein At2g35030, mitochondrial-like n=1 Tax=Selaginella moellendorffii TaxID=88036 RepID=UPI000D1D126A|nr:pentatricopeptide repeat-containing protein At2g35030, mitochondrial-like [Selaginella moellendorffii]|eukprot:XP_024527308.1 pentatricopeptide repeat-containing protein At2g35030, mitochondrial-like [Selaginella moellendorffii]
MVAAIALHGILSLAGKILSTLPDQSIVSWNAMIPGCAQNGHERKAAEFFGSMELPTAMADVLGRAGLVAEAEGLLLVMPFQPHFLAWKSLISACKVHGSGKNIDAAARAAEKLLEMELALYVLMSNPQKQDSRLPSNVQMPQRDISAWMIFITACENRGNLEECRSLFDQVPEWDVNFWNSLLTVYTHNGHMDQARQIFDGMVEHNIVSWAVMVTAYARKEERCIAVDNITALAERYQLEEARIHLPDDVVWTDMILAYSNHGHLEEAMKMFARMPQRDLVA